MHQIAKKPPEETRNGTSFLQKRRIKKAVPTGDQSRACATAMAPGKEASSEEANDGQQFWRNLPSNVRSEKKNSSAINIILLPRSIGRKAQTIHKQ
jgi:hypothetical protein